MQGLLEERRKLFSSFSLNEEDLKAYRIKAKELLQQPPLCDEVYRCEFLGFIDAEGRLPGCLIHPELHGGRDLRDLSFYGKELCQGHLCISHFYLNEEEQEIVVRAVDDWYIYGLVVTDIDFVKGILGLLADTLGMALKPKHLATEAIRDELTGLFTLKELWPFKDGRPRLGKYWFSWGEYRIDHPWDDPWDRVLGCLETDPSLWEEAKVHLLKILKGASKRISNALGGP